MRLPWDLRSFVQNLSGFPWKSTLLTLHLRFREDRLGMTASSLTFTTTIALVPLITVALAVFSAFPMFGKLQLVLQRWLVDSLVPESISRQVLGYLTQFAGQANRLGTIGLVALFGTALALILTIDRTLNAIWRVRQPRPLAQRMLIYWSGMTLGPLLLGASVTMTSYAVSASKGLVGGMPGGIGFLLDGVQFIILSAGTAALYYYVPNTGVKWSHAWAGGLFVSAGMEVAKKLLVLYLGKVPTYSVIYGTFATVPILLVWIYLAWVIVLLGAVITAYLPSLRSGVVRHDLGAGGRFQLALESLQFLHRARATAGKGLTVSQLTCMLQVSHLDIESALAALVELDWVARLDDGPEQAEPRFVLLADPDTTPMAPLMQSLMLRRTVSTEKLWRGARWGEVRLREVL
ncbi:MAG: YihY family inner membrane protein [Rhodoferax sp.]|nr:YihY family inner membrane protein [Rhodoferax sp.]